MFLRPKSLQASRWADAAPTGRASIAYEGQQQQQQQQQQLVPAPVVGVSWGADHRVVDGAALALASNAFKELCEEPARMLLYLR